MDLESLEKDKEALKQASESARIMADMMQCHERENKRLWCAVLALAAAFAIMAGCMVWAVANAQKVANEAMKSALDSVAEIGVTQEETTTQTVEGDSAEINNVQGDQYKDNATHNDFTADSEKATE